MYRPRRVIIAADDTATQEPPTVRRWHAVVLVAALDLRFRRLRDNIVKELEVDPFDLSLGSIPSPGTNGSIRLDRTAGVVTIGTSIDWERDLAGETSMTVPRIDGYYRFAPKHRVDFSWGKIERNGTIATQRDIDFGNVLYPIGTSLTSQLDTETAKLAYTYSFYRNNEIETSISAGLHVTQIENVAAGQRARGRREQLGDCAPAGIRLPFRRRDHAEMVDARQVRVVLSRQRRPVQRRPERLHHRHRASHLPARGLRLRPEPLQPGRGSGGSDKRGAFSSVLSGFMLYAVLR